MMAGKHKPSADQSQSDRFIETARQLGCDESEERFEAAFRKIVPPRHEGDLAKPGKSQKRSVRQSKAKKPGR